MRKLLLVLFLFLFSTSVSWSEDNIKLRLVCKYKTENYCAGKQEKNINDCKFRDYSDYYDNKFENGLFSIDIEKDNAFIETDLLTLNSNLFYTSILVHFITDEKYIFYGEHIFRTTEKAMADITLILNRYTGELSSRTVQKSDKDFWRHIIYSCENVQKKF